MIIYILKFSAILFILLVFYKLALESSSLHKLKRVYLLGAVVISLTFPLITFNHYVEIPAISNEITTTNPEIEVGSQEILVNINTSITEYLPQILWTLYLLGFIIFSIRFANNLKEIYKRVKLNPQIRDKNFIHVLLIDLFVPHTFFNYIFLNKDLFINKKIPKEVFIHEQAHARQLHSLDILIVELLQVILWFNPLILLLKKQIKINHEFLADQAVLNEGICTKSYQNLLLEFSSHSYSPTIANAINYSLTRNTLGVIKKRFTVMKTKTSKKAMCIKSILILPLLGLLLYGFSETKEVDIYEDESTHSTTHTARSIEIEILENDLFLIDGIVTDKASFISTLNSLHQDITTDIRNDIINIHVNSKTKIKDEDVWFIYNSSFDYGFYRLVTDKQEVIKAKGNTPFAIETNDFKLNSDTIDYEKSGFNYQDNATEDEVKEYNRLAKKYNEMDRNKMNIQKSEIDRLTNIYNRMSVSQRNEAEPFPQIPEPPKPPKIPTFNEKKSNSTKKMEEKLPPPPPPPPPKFESSPEPKPVGKLSEHKTPNPPPPPKPEDPIDHIIRMAKKNAAFFYEGKPIDSDKAIDILKKNKKLNIQIREENSDRPKVLISTKPIYIKKKPQDKILTVNGKTPKDNQVVLNKKEIINLKLNIKDAKVTEYKLKIPGVKTLFLKSDGLDEKAKKIISTLEEDSYIQLFDIKTSDDKKNKPIMIHLKE